MPYAGRTPGGIPGGGISGPGASLGGRGGPSDQTRTAAAAVAARRLRIAGYRTAAYAGSKYQPNAEGKELIGITDAVLFWASESGVDNSVDDAANSGLHLTIFDTTTRADSAQIKLLNDSGVTQYVVAAAIKAKPVTRMSGDQGFTHDSFVDYEDIFLNGENTFEFGNNFIVTKTQLEQLADFYAKTLGVIIGADPVLPRTSVPRAKHIYTVNIPGRCWWFMPGKWYALQVGGVGQREYIDSVCECYNLQIDAPVDGLGSTRVSFREVEQNWVKDSNAVARFLATGDPKWKPNNFGRVVVAAKNYLGVADYYCDGTADQVEIQAAIDYIARAFGGGVVELTEGQFNITAAIDLNYNNMILIGHGAKTIIEKNCNDYAIDITGSVGNIKSNIVVSDLHIKTNTADTNNIEAIRIKYASDVKIQMCFFTNIYSIAIDIYDDCENSILLARNTFTNCGAYGSYVISSRYRCSILDNLLFSNRALLGTISCPVFGASGALIQGNKIYDNYGIGISPASDTKVIDNYIANNGQLIGGTIRAGIHIESAGWENVSVSGNDCKDNGSLIANGVCE